MKFTKRHFAALAVILVMTVGAFISSKTSYAAFDAGKVTSSVGKLNDAATEVNNLNKAIMKIIEAAGAIFMLFGVYKFSLAMTSSEAKDYANAATFLAVGAMLANATDLINLLG